MTLTDSVLEPAVTPERTIGRLRRIRVAAFLDLVLLVSLLVASFSGAREWVRILGPLHGANYLVLCVLFYVGASDGLWSWWYLAATVFTGGPPGALVGEVLISRRVRRSQRIREGEV
jgi:hypothetical protein